MLGPSSYEVSIGIMASEISNVMLSVQMTASVIGVNTWFLRFRSASSGTKISVTTRTLVSIGVVILVVVC